MAQPLFQGLIFNEAGEPAEVAWVGTEAQYVINDMGFRRHVPSETIDRDVLKIMREQIMANRDMTTQGVLQMMGKDDLFTKAMVDSSISNIDEHIDKLFKSGLPAGAQQWMGMMGFKIIVNHRGEIIDFDQPGMALDDE